MWFNEIFTPLFGTSSFVFIRKRKGFHPDCALPKVKHGGENVLVLSCLADSELCKFHINSDTYITVLNDVLRLSVKKILAQKYVANKYFNKTSLNNINPKN